MHATSDRGKQPISATMAGPYGHPFHPILVTIPIGAWAASLVFDITSHLVSAPAFLTAGSTWLIGIGVVGAVAAALVGLLDLLARDDIFVESYGRVRAAELGLGFDTTREVNPG